MAIDREPERISAINQLTGLRVLRPNGAIDQDTRQASCRTCLAVLAIPPIIILESAITIVQAISATFTNDIAIDSPIVIDPAINGTGGVNT